MYPGADCPVRGLGEHRNSPVLHARSSGASASLQLLERATLNLTSTGSPPALQLSDQ